MWIEWWYSHGSLKEKKKRKETPKLIRNAKQTEVRFDKKGK